MTALRWARTLAQNTRANAATILALAFVPIMLVVGFAIDFERQQNYQSKVQNALDFAVVATARHALKNDSTDAELKVIAQNFFDGEMAGMPNMNLNPLTFNRNGDEVTLDVRGDMPTSIMQIAGQKTMPLGTESVAVFGEPSSAEIALVLDTSFSMKGSRMTTLESAANDMIDTLVDSSSTAVKMSIVPFATYVNVGTDKKGESWLTVQADKTTNSQSCWIPNWWYKQNCTRESYSCTRDGVSRTCKRWKCDPDEKADAPRKCKPVTRKRTWHGCVRSRQSPYNIKDSNYSAQKVYGFISNNASTCPTAIQELTNDPTKLKAKVTALNPNQNTYIATGLSWGFRTLTPGAPFDEAEDNATFAAKNGRRALVLMSDGENTKAPNNGNGMHNSSSRTRADTYTEDMCDEIKANDIELYTIAFEIDDVATKTLLRNCATDSSFYYDAKNSADLKDAFAQISNEFRDIALAR